jgi:hypothetical protein
VKHKKREVPDYRATITLKNRCGMVVVFRVVPGSRILRRVGRATWPTDTERGPTLQREAEERMKPIINTDLKKLGLMPKPLSRYHY